MYVFCAASKAGAVSAQTEERKKVKYANLELPHFFTQVAVGTYGSFGPETPAFLRVLGPCIMRVSDEENAYSFLIHVQRLTVEIQSGNSASVMGTFGGTNSDGFTSATRFIIGLVYILFTWLMFCIPGFSPKKFCVVN